MKIFQGIKDHEIIDLTRSDLCMSFIVRYGTTVCILYKKDLHLFSNVKNLHHHQVIITTRFDDWTGPLSAKEG